MPQTERSPENARTTDKSPLFDQQYLALSLILYLTTFSAACFAIFLGSFLSSQALGARFVGLIGSAGSAGAMIGNFFWGFLSDRLGHRRRLILVGGFLTAPCMLMWLAQGSWQRYVVLNFACSFLLVATVSLLSVLALDLISPAGRAQRYGTFRLWGSAGLLSASWGIGWLLKANPHRIFMFSAGAMFLAMLPTLFGTRESVRSRSPRFHFGHVLRNSRLLVFFLCTLLHGIWEPACFLFLAYSLRQQQAGEGIIGIILGLNGLVALVSLPLAGRLADKWGRPPMLVAMYLISSLRMLLYSVTSTPLAYVPLQILHFGTFGIAEAVGSVYISELADDRDRATALSCFDIFHALGALIGNVVGGIISSAYGFPIMYQAFGGLMVVSASIFAATQLKKTQAVNKS